MGWIKSVFQCGGRWTVTQVEFPGSWSGLTPFRGAGLGEIHLFALLNIDQGEYQYHNHISQVNMETEVGVL